MEAVPGDRGGKKQSNPEATVKAELTGFARDWVWVGQKERSQGVSTAFQLEPPEGWSCHSLMGKLLEVQTGEEGAERQGMEGWRGGGAVLDWHLEHVGHV